MQNALQGGTAQSVDACIMTAPIVPGKYDPAYMARFNYNHIHSLVNSPYDESAVGPQAPTAADAETTSGAASAEPGRPLSALGKQNDETQLRAFLNRAMLGTPSPEAKSLAERGLLLPFLTLCVDCITLMPHGLQHLILPALTCFAKCSESRSHRACYVDFFQWGKAYCTCQYV